MRENSGLAAPRKFHNATSPRIKEQSVQRNALQQLEANKMEAPANPRLSIVSEGDEQLMKSHLTLELGDEESSDSPARRMRAARPAKARLSGSESDWQGDTTKQRNHSGAAQVVAELDMQKLLPQRNLSGPVVAEHDMQKLLPGQMRGFRPAPSHHEEAPVSQQGPLSARTLISGKSTARAGEIDGYCEVDAVKLQV